MIGESKTVKDLDDSKNDYAIKYKGTIYRVQDISKEGNLRRVKLVSLKSYEILIVLWHPDSLLICSSLLIKRCLINKRVKDDTYEIESLNNINNKIELNNEESIKAYRFMTENKLVYVILYFCFDQTIVGNVYALPHS